MGTIDPCRRGPERAARRGSQGFSRLELLISATVVTVFMAVLLDRLFYYQEEVEKVAMEATARQIDSALRIRAAELILANRSAELAALERVDPFQLFAVPPGNYAGATNGEREATNAGVWHYDLRQREVYYRPSSHRHLRVVGAGDAPTIRYRVRLLRAAGGEGVVGVRFECMTAYRWFE